MPTGSCSPDTMMLSAATPTPSKKMRKYWDGYPLHPFIELLHAALLSRGYRFIRQSEDEFTYRWSKPIFPGYEQGIMVTPAKAKGLPKSNFGVGLSLFIDSDRQTEIENMLETWNCYNLDPMQQRIGRMGFKEAPTPVLHASLEWLMARWEPKLPSFSEAFARWECVPTAQAQACVDDVEFYLDRQGKDFFEYVGAPLKLAQTLRDLDSFPGRTPKSGPSSTAPDEYAAVLLHDAGLTTEAQKELDLSLRVLQVRVNRGERQQMVLDIQRCKVQRYLQWMSVM